MHKASWPGSWCIVLPREEMIVKGEKVRLGFIHRQEKQKFLVLAVTIFWAMVL